MKYLLEADRFLAADFPPGNLTGQLWKGMRVVDGPDGARIEVPTRLAGPTFARDGDWVVTRFDGTRVVWPNASMESIVDVKHPLVTESETIGKVAKSKI